MRELMEWRAFLRIERGGALSHQAKSVDEQLEAALGHCMRPASG